MGTSRTEVRKGYFSFGIRRRDQTEFPHFSKQWHFQLWIMCKISEGILVEILQWLDVSEILPSSIRSNILLTFWRDTKRIVTGGREASILCRARCFYREHFHSYCLRSRRVMS